MAGRPPTACEGWPKSEPVVMTSRWPLQTAVRHASTHAACGERLISALSWNQAQPPSSMHLIAARRMLLRDTFWERKPLGSLVAALRFSWGSLRPLRMDAAGTVPGRSDTSCSTRPATAGVTMVEPRATREPLTRLRSPGGWGEPGLLSSPIHMTSRYRVRRRSPPSFSLAGHGTQGDPVAATVQWSMKHPAEPPSSPGAFLC